MQPLLFPMELRTISLAVRTVLIARLLHELTEDLRVALRRGFVLETPSVSGQCTLSSCSPCLADIVSLLCTKYSEISCMGYTSTCTYGPVLLTTFSPAGLLLPLLTTFACAPFSSRCNPNVLSFFYPPLLLHFKDLASNDIRLYTSRVKMAEIPNSESTFGRLFEILTAHR